MTLSCRSSPLGRLSALWSQLLRRRNALTISSSPTASSPWGRPYHRQSPQDTLSPSTSPTPVLHRTYFSQILFPEMSLFPSEHSRAPLIPPASQPSEPRRPVLKQLTAGRGPRHPSTHTTRSTGIQSRPGPAADHVEPKGWDLTQERPSGAGARGCRSEPARSMSRTWQNLHLCGADN